MKINQMGQPVGANNIPVNNIQFTSGYTTPLITEPVQVGAINPFGINMSTPVVNIQSGKTDSILNEVINNLPDNINSNNAIANLKSLVQNRKLSVEKDMSPVTNVFAQKVAGALVDLLKTDYNAFDKVIDNILAKPVNATAGVAPVSKSKYTGNNNIDSNEMELIKAAINYMNREKIININNMGKFNKIITDMIAETKNKKFSNLITKTPMVELYKKFKSFVGGGN